MAFGEQLTPYGAARVVQAREHPHMLLCGGVIDVLYTITMILNYLVMVIIT